MNVTRSPHTPRQQPPEAVEYSSPEERVRALEEDNEVLRAMMQRMSAGSSRYDPSIVMSNLLESELHHQVDVKKQELKAERQRRSRTESLLKETKCADEVVLHKKQQELRRAQDQLLSTRNELAALNEKVKEQESLISILKKENFRLTDVLKTHGIKDGGKSDLPDYFAGNGNVRPNRLKKDVPSAKNFSNLLAVSPLKLQQTILSPTKFKLQYPRSASTERKGSPNPRPSCGVGIRSPSQEKRGYTTAPALRNRSRSPSGMVRAVHHKVGSRVMWKGKQAIVRYIGEVHCLGDGVWCGIELAIPGTGDHNGTLSGVRYFSAAAKSAVFCSLSELETVANTSNESVSAATTPRSLAGQYMAAMKTHIQKVGAEEQPPEKTTVAVAPHEDVLAFQNDVPEVSPEK